MSNYLVVNKKKNHYRFSCDMTHNDIKRFSHDVAQGHISLKELRMLNLWILSILCDHFHYFLTFLDR